MGERTPTQIGADVAKYVIYFNQQWVGDHPDEWVRERGRQAMVVVDEMRAAGVLGFAGGLEEDLEAAFSADPDGTVRPGPHVRADEFLGGLTILDVPDDETALMWARKIAAACGWPQEVRRAY
jgi:hypothetical protein